jgi:hypothetical protein
MEALVMQNTPATTEQLVRLLEDQLQLVEQLAKLATRQGDLIAAGRSEPLLALLADRQEVMDVLAAGQEDLGELCRAAAADVDLTESDRQRVRGLIDAITDSLNGILRNDEVDREAMAVVRDRVRADLDKFGSARAAHRAYAVGRPAGSRFADRQG